MTDVTVLTVAPLGGYDMANWCGGWARRDGRHPVEVPSAANLDANTIPDTADALEAMAAEVLEDPDALLAIMCHSQGCQVAGEALARWAAHPETAPDPARVTRILLTGNLERPRLGYVARKPWWIPRGNGVRLTPEDTPYTILDIGRQGDLWANYPGGFPNMAKMMMCLPHVNYSSVNPDSPVVVSRKQVGLSTYLVVP